VGSPDALRERTGGPRVEIVGRDFTDTALSAVRALPGVTGAELQSNGHLLIDLRAPAGSVDQPSAAPVVAALVGAGAAIEEVHRGAASLEEVFLTLMQEGEPAREGVA
jgi:hypothetical protein